MSRWQAGDRESTVPVRGRGRGGTPAPITGRGGLACPGTGRRRPRLRHRATAAATAVGSRDGRRVRRAHRTARLGRHVPGRPCCARLPASSRVLRLSAPTVCEGTRPATSKSRSLTAGESGWATSSQWSGFATTSAWRCRSSAHRGCGWRRRWCRSPAGRARRTMPSPSSRTPARSDAPRHRDSSPSWTREHGCRTAGFSQPPSPTWPSARCHRWRRDTSATSSAPTACRPEDVSGWSRPGRSPAYRDVEYVGLRTLVELNGRLGHEWAAEVWDDLDRDLDSATTDLITLRAGWRQVLQPCRLAGIVGRVLVARGWTGRPHPCGPDCVVWTPLGT